MPTLRFAQDNSKVSFNLPPACDFTGAFTLAALVRRRSAFEGLNHAILMHHDDINNMRVGMEFGYDFMLESDDHLMAVTQSNPSYGAQSSDITNWLIAVVSRPAGASQTLDTSIYNFGLGMWQHATGNTQLSNAASASAGYIIVGEYMGVEDLNANVAVIGGWSSYMNQTQREALAANLRTSDWAQHSITPKYLHELTSKTSIPDLMGNGATLAYVTGTTLDSSSDPPGWTFDGVGVPTKPPAQNIDITNPGGGTLNWAATKTAAWLSLSPTSGTTTAETDQVAVVADPAGLSPGVYTDKIIVKNPSYTPEITDNFNRANGAVGANWTAGYAGGLLVDTNQLRGPGTWAQMVWATALAAPHYVSTLIGVDPPLDNNYMYLQLLTGTNASTASGYVIEFDNDYYGLFRYDAGVPTRILPAGMPHDVNYFLAGDRIALVIEGDHILILRTRAGVVTEMARILDTTYRPANMYRGLEFSAQTTVRLDDFSAKLLTPTQEVGVTFNVAAGTGDTTPPTPNVTVTTATRMSRVAGKDSSDVTFTSNEAFVEYQIRKVASASDSVTQGTLIETATVSSRTSHTVTITDDEIVAAEGSVIPGDKLIKVFVRDAAGNWSA